MFLPLYWSNFLLFWHSIWKSIFFVSLIRLIVSQTSSCFRRRVCGFWGGAETCNLLQWNVFLELFPPVCVLMSWFFFFNKAALMLVAVWILIKAPVTGAQMNSSSKQTVCFQKGRLSCFCFLADFDEAKKKKHDVTNSVRSWRSLCHLCW